MLDSMPGTLSMIVSLGCLHIVCLLLGWYVSIPGILGMITSLGCLHIVCPLLGLYESIPGILGKIAYGGCLYIGCFKLMTEVTKVRQAEWRGKRPRGLIAVKVSTDERWHLASGGEHLHSAIAEKGGEGELLPEV